MIISYNDKAKIFLKRSLIIISILVFIFIIAFVILRYEVEGEKIENLPFKIDKITVASTVDAIKNEDEENLWNLSLLQVNDIYIKIDKNENKEEQLGNLIINNIKMNQTIGEQKITKLIKNKYDNEELNEIQFKGENATNLEGLTILKQGGTIGFRYVIQNLGNYISNDEEVKYNMELLQKSGISVEQIKTNLSFDIILELENNIKYKANILLELPLDENSNVKDVDTNGIIFKRVLQK